MLHRAFLLWHTDVPLISTLAYHGIYWFIVSGPTVVPHHKCASTPLHTSCWIGIILPLPVNHSEAEATVRSCMSNVHGKRLNLLTITISMPKLALDATPRMEA